MAMMLPARFWWWLRATNTQGAADLGGVESGGSE